MNGPVTRARVAILTRLNDGRLYTRSGAFADGDYDSAAALDKLVEQGLVEEISLRGVPMLRLTKAAVEHPGREGCVPPELRDPAESPRDILLAAGTLFSRYAGEHIGKVTVAPDAASRVASLHKAEVNNDIAARIRRAIEAMDAAAEPEVDPVLGMEPDACRVCGAMPPLGLRRHPRWALRHVGAVNGELSDPTFYAHSEGEIRSLVEELGLSWDETLVEEWDGAKWEERSLQPIPGASAKTIPSAADVLRFIDTFAGQENTAEDVRDFAQTAARFLDEGRTREEWEAEPKLFGIIEFFTETGEPPTPSEAPTARAEAPPGTIARMMVGTAMVTAEVLPNGHLSLVEHRR